MVTAFVLPRLLALWTGSQYSAASGVAACGWGTAAQNDDALRGGERLRAAFPLRMAAAYHSLEGRSGGIDSRIT